ncbi:MAG: acyl carrier protein [Lachnospiraceae bacterium]|nr:acyl carrier protein [Lachnospiraceae bacterium]
MNVKETLTEVFQDVFDDDELELFDEMTAEDVEDWTSLTHIQLIVAVEKKFGVKFTTVEVMKLKNVGEFIALIEKKLA